MFQPGFTMARLRDRREPRATRQEEQYNPGACSDPNECGSGAFSGHEGSTLPPALRIDWLPTRDWLCRHSLFSAGGGKMAPYRDIRLRRCDPSHIALTICLCLGGV